jgi:hypothetical protein
MHMTASSTYYTSLNSEVISAIAASPPRLSVAVRFRTSYCIGWILEYRVRSGRDIDGDCCGRRNMRLLRLECSSNVTLAHLDEWHRWVGWWVGRLFKRKSELGLQQARIRIPIEVVQGTVGKKDLIVSIDDVCGFSSASVRSRGVYIL